MSVGKTAVEPTSIIRQGNAIKNTAYASKGLLSDSSSGNMPLNDSQYKNKASASSEQSYFLNEVNPVFNAGKVHTIEISPETFNQPGTIILVNKHNPLDRKFIPDNLANIIDKSKNYIIPAKSTGIQMKKEVLDAAKAMFNAANNEGIDGLVVSNAYRSYSLQSYFYTKKVNCFLERYSKEDAKKKAAMIVAPPGQSEHQTGLAIDITTKELLKTKDPLVAAFAQTREGKWIFENSWKYGFIVRYSADKTNITGIISEPWHIRYVGKPHAEYMLKNNMCLEEYLEHIKNKSYIKYKDFEGISYEIFYISNSSPDGKLFLELHDGQQYEISDISAYGKSGFIVTKKLK